MYINKHKILIFKNKKCNKPFIISGVLICLMIIFVPLIVFLKCNSLNQNIVFDTSNSFSDEFLTVKDTCNLESNVIKNVNRIVALSASDVEVLVSLGAKNKIIAKGNDCEFADPNNEIFTCGSGENTSIETIANLHPDVVLMSKMNQTLGHVNSIKSLGIPCLVNDVNSLEQAYSYILLLGDISGKQSEANEMVLQMKNRFSNLNHLQSGNTIYFDISPESHSIWTAGSKTLLNEIAGLLDLKNIYDDVEGYVNVSPEDVIIKNPDYIICLYDKNLNSEDLYSRPGWNSLKAFCGNCVLYINDGSLSIWGPRLADGAKKLYDLIYP